MPRSFSFVCRKKFNVSNETAENPNPKQVKKSFLWTNLIRKLPSYDVDDEKEEMRILGVKLVVFLIIRWFVLSSSGVTKSQNDWLYL